MKKKDIRVYRMKSLEKSTAKSPAGKLLKKRINVIFLITAIILIPLLISILLCLLIAFFPAENRLLKNSALAVIPGAGITIRGEPSTALRYRLDKAAEYYKQGKILKILVSGTVAETFIMKQYLKNKGIPYPLIDTDHAGEDTAATVRNTKHYCLSNSIRGYTVFISQRYHLARILYLSWKMGVPDAGVLSADTLSISPHRYMLLVIREFLGFTKAVFID